MSSANPQRKREPKPALVETDAATALAVVEEVSDWGSLSTSDRVTRQILRDRMSGKPQRSRKREPKPLPNERWCTAKEIAQMFGLKLSTVYHGQAGTHKIRRAYQPGTENNKRPTVRFWYADAVAMSEQMLRESEPQNGLPAPILRLVQRMPVRRRQGGAR